MTTTKYALFTTILVAPAVATAAPCPSDPALECPAPGVRTHDGFLLNLTTGLGALNEGIPESGASVFGVGGHGTLVLGGHVAESISIGVESTALQVSDPDIDGATASGATMTTYFLGPMVQRWHGRNNWYSRVAVGGLVQSISYQGQRSSSDAGLCLSLTNGKTWWVSDSWSLGVGVNLLWGHTAASADVYRSNHFDLSLDFVAFYD